MELLVKLVAGKDNCFVSLPLPLIQTLQSTSSGQVPSLLTLELRSDSNHWVVAWAGDSSASSAIEVAQQFGECIGLADNASVKVRVVSNVPHATLVTIEPDTEDDWEVLELNSENAEAAILKQVRILHEAMRFPLWLHGRTFLTFHVVSSYPKKAVVQLMPGTEVAVAPKRRKKNLNSDKNSSLESLNEEYNSIKAVLRIQESDRRFITNANVKGVNLGVVLTSVGFIHPETAKSLSLEMLQSILVIPRFSKESLKVSGSNISKTKSDLVAKVVDHQNLTDKQEYRQAVVHILISDSVAKGHLMVARSLRLYLRASLHSWVFLKTCQTNEKKIPSISFSPCHFKLMSQENTHNINGLKALDNYKIHKKKMHTKTGSELYKDIGDWSHHDEVITILSEKLHHKSNEHAAYQSDCEGGIHNLVLAWFSAQLEAISSISGIEVNSLLLNGETLFHMEVNCYTEGTHVRVNASSNSSLENRHNVVQILYLLTLNEESSYDRKVKAYEVSFGERNQIMNDPGDFRLFEKIKYSDPVSFSCNEERIDEAHDSLDISSFGWIAHIASDVFNRLSLLLSSSSGFWFNSHNFPLPGHILIYGPSGSGKTSLAKAAAKSLENHGEILAHTIFINCSRFNSEKILTIREAISSYICEALNHAPSIVIFDDLDSIISSSESEGSQSMATGAALIDFVVDIIDEYGEKRLRSCGIGPMTFIATVQSLRKIPQPLSSSGRFDFHVQLPAPASLERAAMLRHEIQRRSLQCSHDILHNVASKCDGYDSYDLEILVVRAVHSAVSRFLSFNGPDEHEKPTLLEEDFSKAMHDFLPIAMRDITKPATDGSHSGWNNVGGLVDIQNAIKEMIELPSRFPKIFAQAPLRLRSNVLLYGPPGCGKTHIVGAAAAACSLRFISVKGPELLNKYIGASEQAVRDIFSKATAAAPCLLFFDEFDSIAPKRGHDNTGVTDRVVNQFLTELDGVEVLNGVFVFAATSRPDLLDAALLRPGRLDRLLFCDFPSLSERLDILQVLSRKLPIADDVDLDAIARMTEGFSGADLQALLSDAQLAAVHEVLDNVDASVSKRSPVITYTLLKSIASKARPSVSEEEKRRLYNIYSQFLDAKRSVAAQSKDAKGKRATLA